MKQKPANKPTIKPAATVSPKKGTIKGNQKPFFLDSYMEKYGIWITLGLVSVLIFIIYFDFILGNKFYLFKDIGSDSINYSLPQITLLTNHLHTEGFPLWSFSQGMGQNIMPSLSDPFNWIVILFGTGNIEYGFIWMEISKLLLTAFFFYNFLFQFRLSSISLLIGTMLYTFSGFMIVGSGWYIFSAEACLLALLLLSFEKLYRGNSWYLFPIAIALITMIQPFDLYFYGLFLIIYFLFRHFSTNTSSWKKLLSSSIIMLGLGLIGVIISSFFLISTLQTLLDSPRVGGGFSYTNLLLSKPIFGFGGNGHNHTAIMRFFSNDLLGNGSSFKGWYNYMEAPMFYIGLLPLLLFPQIFTLIETKKKFIFGAFITFFLIPIIFPFFRYSFWLFTGDYYRGFSLFISLCFLIFSLLVVNELDKIKKVSWPLLAATLIGLIILLYFPYQNTGNILQKNLRSLILVFLFLYTIIILLLNYSKNRNTAKILLTILVFFEIGIMTNRTVNDRTALSKNEVRQKSGYNDYSIEATAYVKSIDKGFFRINKEYASGPTVHTSFNDSKMQGYFGTPSYASFNQKYYIRFLEEAGIVKKGDETQSRWASGLTTRPLLHFFSSVKYDFTKQSNSQLLQLGYDSITQIGDVKILKNRYSLPLGFTYTKYIPLKQYQKLTELQKQLTLLKAFVVEESDLAKLKSFSEFNLQDTTKNYSWDELEADVVARKADTLKMTSFTNNKIKGIIELKENKLLFFSIPFDKGWHCLIDGKQTEPILSNIGFCGIELMPGRHNIELFYEPPFFKVSFIATLVGLLLYMLVIFIKQYNYKKTSQSQKITISDNSQL
jgi:uncharacterized membrane protein YfhO